MKLCRYLTFELRILPKTPKNPMLFVLTMFFSIVVLAGALIQAVPIMNLCRKVKQPHRTPISDDQCRPVAVVMSLRGGDPFLEECLNRIIQQDYPDYEIVIALDNENDPAVPYVDRLNDAQHSPRLTKKIITERSKNCTLVNSNYARVVEEIDDRFEFVVFVDADAVTWSGWLRALIQPLIENETIGASSGNRWYTPENGELGSLVRAFWNMGSVIQMAQFRFPWGGSLAIRTDIAKSDEMLQQWRTSFSADAPVFNVVKREGKKFFFNPHMLLLNSESTNLKTFSNWIPRQMIQGKLYHPKWMPVLIQGIIMAFVFLGALATNFTNLFLGKWVSFCVLGGALTFAWGITCLFFIVMNHVITRRHSELTREVRADWLTVGNILRLPQVSLIALVVCVVALVKVLRIRRIEWRGIAYQIRKPFDIELEEYKPFRQPRADSQYSL